MMIEPRTRAIASTAAAAGVAIVSIASPRPDPRRRSGIGGALTCEAGGRCEADPHRETTAGSTVCGCVIVRPADTCTRARTRTRARAYRSIDPHHLTTSQPSISQEKDRLCQRVAGLAGCEALVRRARATLTSLKKNKKGADTGCGGRRMAEPGAPAPGRKHRNALGLAIEALLRERGFFDREEPAQLDLFLSPAEAARPKQRRGRPRTARAPRKSRRR